MHDRNRRIIAPHPKTACIECLKGNCNLFIFKLIYSAYSFPEMLTRKMVCGISEVHSRMLLRTNVSRDTCKMIGKRISLFFTSLSFYFFLYEMHE